MALNELHGKQARLIDLVSIQPGATAFTRTPCGENSVA